MAARTEILIRRSTTGDAEALAELAQRLVHHEGKPTGHLTPETLSRWLAGPEPMFEALIAELERDPVGYVAFYRAFSLYKGGPVFLVENLFVAARARRLGIGRRLIAAAAAEAKRRGYPRLELNVSNDNPESHAFYEALGFIAPGESVYRIEDQPLLDLAAEHG